MRQLILLSCVLLFKLSFGQQAGDLDTSFNGIMYSKFHNGKQFRNDGNNDSHSDFVFESSSGAIYAGGTVSECNGILGYSIFKFDSLGVIDTSFHSDFGYAANVNSAVEQPDGKIIMVGKFPTYDGSASSCIVRINPDGTKDQSFNVGTGATNNDNSAEIYDVHIDDNGKIIIAGEFYSFNGVNRRGIARLNSNGSIDFTFNPGTGFFALDATGVTCMEVQSDGKILVGGWFTYYGGPQNGLIRLNTNGSKDLTFVGVGITGWESKVKTILKQSDGRILVGGKFTTVNSSSTSNFARLLTNGNPDVSFNQNVLMSGGVGILSTLGLQSDQKILMEFGTGTYGGQSVDGLMRLDTAGIIDTTFNLNHDFTDNISTEVRQIWVLPNDKLLLAGKFTGLQGYLKRAFARLDKNGFVDTEFARSTGAITNDPYSGEGVYCFEKDSFGRIYIGGEFTEYNGILVSGIARIFDTGELDTSFIVSIPGGRVLDIEIQNDGKVVIVGDFNVVNGNLIRGIARLNNDGTLDNSFQINDGVSGGPYQTVKTVDIQPWDGKILFAGSFDFLDGIAIDPIVRLYSNGTIDPTFSLNINPGYDVHKVEVLPNGKILVSGGYITFCEDNLSRLLPNGTCDNSFTIFSNNVNYEIEHEIQPDGRIVLGTDERFYENGLEDNSFNVDLGWGGSLGGVAFQQDGMIIIAGDFEVVNGVPRKGVARVYPDGSLDYSFNPGLAFDVNSLFNIHSIFLDDTVLYIGGTFEKYQGKFQNNLVRIHAPLLYHPLDIDVLNAKDVSCNSPGEISVTGVHGTPPYAYEWSNTMPTVSDSTITCTTGGIYTCKVTDSNGLIDSVSVLISEAATDQSDLRVTVSASDYDAYQKVWMVINGMNDGCTPKSGFIRLVYEGDKLDIESMPGSAPSSWIGDTLIWNFSNLSWDSPRLLLNLVFDGLQGSLIDPLKFEVYIDTTGNDWNIENNHYDFEIKTTTDQIAFDNVIKTAFPPGSCDQNFIQANQPFHYSMMVRNRNQLNQNAMDVTLYDTLDQSIDLNNVRVIASNDYVWTEVKNGSELIFHLDSCNLPVTPLGFNMAVQNSRIVTFEIDETEMNHPHGVSLENQVTAELDLGYSTNFFYSSNNVVNQVFNDGSLIHYDCDNPNLNIDDVTQFMDDELMIFPNPTNGLLKVMGTHENLRYELFDLLGKKIMEGSTQEDIFIQKERGTYVMKIYKSDESSESFKIVLH